jgi:hypothetical protein
LNDILNLQSGMPYNVSLGYNSAGLDQGTERPSWVHKPGDNCSLKKTVIAGGNATSCIDTTAYVLPVAPTTVNSSNVVTAYNYAYGNTSRNTLHGPGFAYDNFSIFKDFAIWERIKFQFRAEAFNVTNHPSGSNPNASLNAASQSGTAVSTSNNIGTITSVQTLPGELSGARILQLSGKIVF